MPTCRQSGHTLLELLVVLAIIAFAAAVAAPAFGGSRGSLEAKALAEALEGELILARSRAVGSANIATVFVDVGAARYRADNASGWVTVNKKLSLRFSSAAPVSGDIAAILYYPDGSSSGGEITIEASDRTYRVRAGINGRVSVERSGTTRTH